MKLRRIAALAIAAAFSVAATKPAPRNWNATVAETSEGGHRLGNPDAPARLVEFVSYTCPHCAAFEKRADSAMRLAYVTPGKLSVEIRPFIRNPVDLAVTLLTTCGAPARFFLNHTAFMRSQDRWIAPLATASTVRQQRWQTGDFASRMRHIATDLRLYDIIATRGYDRQTADRCLTDEAKARRLAERTAEAEALGVAGTPSFMLNGVLLAGTHDWQTLDPQIRARF
ncbi:MAG: thioredoxin domain-containing protein [Novosphingobium sp.]